MRKLLKSCLGCFLFIIAYTGIIAQPNIVKLEYYLDKDPGYGKAISVSFTSSNNISNIPINIDTSNIKSGIHVMFVRAKDANGAWSLENKWIFARPYPSDTTHIIPSNIIQVEYYLDRDPGFGKGKQISFTPGTNLANLSFNIDSSSISNGVHILFVRARDAKGLWSFDNHWIFARPYPSDTAILKSPPSIVQIEYYIDHDPGIGKGKQVSFTTSADIANAPVNLDSSLFGLGVHIFYVRAKDAKGVWGLDNRWIFVRPYSSDTVKAALVNIRQMEYFIDRDPGYGKGVPVAINMVNNIANSPIQMNASSLSVGGHAFYIRSKNINGSWSFVYKDSFKIVTTFPNSIVVNSETKKNLCLKDSFNIAYHATGNYNSGNVFNAELSDTSGGFTNATIIGSYSGTANTIIACKLPNSIPLGSKFRIRVSSTNPVLKGITSIDTFIVHAKPAVQLITGDTAANNLLTNIYSVPAISGSSWIWSSPAAQLTSVGDTSKVIWKLTGNEKLNVVQYSSFGCASDTSSFSVHVYPLLIDSVNITTPSPCTGITDTLLLKVSGVYKAGNIFVAQISDTAGSFNSPKIVGSDTLSIKGITQPVNFKIKFASTLIAGSYKLRVLSTYGKDTSSIQSLFIGAPPTPSVITGATSVSKNAIVSYSVTPIAGVSYVWTAPTGDTIKSGQGTNAITLKCTASGTLSVKAMTKCSLSSARTLSITVTGAATPALTIAEAKQIVDKDVVNLFPNPASNKSMLNFYTETARRYSIEIRDINGKLIYKVGGYSTKGMNHISLELNSMARSVYFVHLFRQGYKNTAVELERY